METNNYHIAALIILLLVSCSKITEVEEETDILIDDGGEAIQVIPDSLISKADNFIISHVGETFFSAYISYDSSLSRFAPADSFCIENPSMCSDFLLEPHIYFVYHFIIPEKEFVDEIIEFVTDTLGNIVDSRDPRGIPGCSNDDCWENFPLIDEEDALVVSRSNGLEEGLREWQTSFHFLSGEFNNYIWTVSNTLYISDSQSGGDVVVINANNGDVIQTVQWMAQP